MILSISLVVHCTTIAPPHFAHNLFDEMPHRAGNSGNILLVIVLEICI
ncbi:hypothetical protein HanXRQr2_Chr09g0393801 [Helianthus annuus]|uniref:Uncharacterized protein n=1 Tax=Helianthus annuus TaxID=4232 RepID=A0A9K3I763_HELAN|nr:hypothetical protein HanXRQr2_Chr09g0393801 [Helianthus annuus]KAJ0542823.1 hypothetical protein HanHA89_Chr09g0344081 [Helianthus annuus]